MKRGSAPAVVLLVAVALSGCTASGGAAGDAAGGDAAASDARAAPDLRPPADAAFADLGRFTCKASGAGPCSAACWCWRSGFPVANGRAMWGTGASDLFVAGRGGAMLHFDSARYRWQATPTTEELTALWGASATALFAVGKRGTILRYDGAAWRAQTSGTTGDLVAAWGSSATDVYAVGQAVLHFDGSRWRGVNTGFAGPFNAVWASGPRDVFVAAINNRIARFDGNRWSSSFPTGQASSINTLWGRGPSEVYAGGTIANSTSHFSNTIMFRFDGSRWSRFGGGCKTLRPVDAIFGVGAADLFVAESCIAEHPTTGHICSRDQISRHQSKVGVTIATLTSEFTTGVRAIWGRNASDVYALHGGALAHYNGALWKPVRGGQKTRATIWAHGPTDIVAAGRGQFCDRFRVGLQPRQELYAFDGRSWKTILSGDGGTSWASGLGGGGPGNTWIATAGGIAPLLRIEAGVVHRVFPGLGPTASAVSGTSATDIFYAAGPQLYRSQGSRRTALPATPAGQSIGALWAVSTRDVFAVDRGARGGAFLAHFNATRGWRVAPRGSVPGWNGVWAAGASDAFAVGPDGAVARYDGARWRTLASGTRANLVGVWGSSPSDVYAVGHYGEFFERFAKRASTASKPVVLRFDGRRWTREDIGLGLIPLAVSGSGPGHVVITGAHGAVVEKRR